MNTFKHISLIAAVAFFASCGKNELVEPAISPAADADQSATSTAKPAITMTLHGKPDLTMPLQGKPDLIMPLEGAPDLLVPALTNGAQVSTTMIDEAAGDQPIDAALLLDCGFPLESAPAVIAER